MLDSKRQQHQCFSLQLQHHSLLTRAMSTDTRHHHQRHHYQHHRIISVISSHQMHQTRTKTSSRTKSHINIVYNSSHHLRMYIYFSKLYFTNSTSAHAIVYRRVQTYCAHVAHTISHANDSEVIGHIVATAQHHVHMAKCVDACIVC